MKGIDLVGESILGKELVTLPALTEYLKAKLNLAILQSSIAELTTQISSKIERPALDELVKQLDAFATKEMLDGFIKEPLVISKINEAVKPIQSSLKLFLTADKLKPLQASIVNIEARLTALPKAIDYSGEFDSIRTDLDKLVTNLA